MHVDAGYHIVGMMRDRCRAADSPSCSTNFNGSAEPTAMSHNSFGHLFRVTTWGESHGPAIGCVVDGARRASR